MGFKSLFALNGPQVPAWALREMLGLLGRGFERGFCFFLIGELPYRYAPLWGSSPMYPFYSSTRIATEFQPRLKTTKFTILLKYDDEVLLSAYLGDREENY